MRLLPYGRDALLVEFDTLAAVHTAHRSLRADLDAEALPGVVELVPAARTVLVVTDPTDPASRGTLDAVRARLEHLDGPDGPDDDTGAVVELAVHYDGEDLGTVADAAGVSADEVVALHTGAEYTVAFGGFAPGFAYLAGLPGPLCQPRLETPRARIPAGAVGVAGEFSGVYPRASPGGWRLLGRLTDAAPVLFDTERDPPALLLPGTRVRFRDAAR